MRAPTQNPLVGPPVLLLWEENEKALINFRKAENDDMDSLQVVRSRKNS